MKVAVIYQFAYPESFGGGEKRLFEIFSRFPNNIEIDWFVQYQENYSSFPQLKRFNIYALENRSRPSQERSIKEILKYCYLLLMKLNFSNYDIIHIGQMPFFHVLVLLVKKFFLSLCLQKTPAITLDWWEYWGNYWKEKYSFPLFYVGVFSEWLIYKLAKNMIVISPKTKKDIVSKTVADIRLFHNGVDLSLIEGAPNLNSGHDLIVFGRVEEWKNPQMAVDVFSDMLKSHPELRLNIVGDGSYLSELKKKSESLGITNSITFHGFAKDQREVYGLIKSTKIMMNFSKQEGGGSITLFEANACGVPVATAFFDNGIDEELVTEENGFFFKDCSIEEISRKLIEYLEDGERQNKKRESSKKFVSQFDWSQISNQYLNYFQSLIESKE